MTLYQVISYYISQSRSLRKNIPALTKLVNSHLVYSNVLTPIVRNADVVARELDMKTRAIQLVKDIGSNKSDEEIWTILQSLPSKDVNSLVKTFISNAATGDQKIARHTAWTEILAVRTEAVEGSAKGLNADFSSPEFANANTSIDLPTPSLWINSNGGEKSEQDILNSIIQKV